MWTTWFWIVMNKGLLIAFFGLGAMRGQRKAGSVYARFGLIPLTSVINFITQILVLYAYYAFIDVYYYDFNCTTTCYKIRKASFGLAIISLILSVVVIIDLIVASCKKSKPIPPPQNAVVPMMSMQPVAVPYADPPQYATTMDIKNPPPYQQNVPVYYPQPAMVPTVQYAVQPVPQKDPNEFRGLFVGGHIALMTLNAIFCSLIIVFMSDCLNPNQ